MTLLHRNPNRLAARARRRVLAAEPPAPQGPRKGEIVRVEREDGRIDVAEVLDVFVSFGITMLTLAHRPHGISTFTTRADAVLAEDVPDVRHDAIDCVDSGICGLHKAEVYAARDNEREVW